MDADALPSPTTLQSSPDLRYQRRIRAAKRAARSELSVSRGDWTRERYHDKGKTRRSFEEDPTSLDGVVDDVPRLDLSALAPSSFAALFEAPRIPCVLSRSAVASWPALEGGPRSWVDDDSEKSGLEALVRRYERGRKKEKKLKVGTDDDGRGVYLSVADFARYCRDPRHGIVDDSPLYVFDSGFASGEESSSESNSSESSSEGENEERRRRRQRQRRRRERKEKKKTTSPSRPHPLPSSSNPSPPLPPLSEDYSVPEPFAEDLLSLAGPRRRPPHRWLVAGPPRSGSAPHVDPLGTSAWNSLLSGGAKRWALFPPGVPREAVVGPRIPGVGREAADWFGKVLPRIRERCQRRGGGRAADVDAGGGGPGSLAPWPWAPPIEIVQRPGETVVVPGGWWHAVINCDGGDSGGASCGEGGGRERESSPPPQCCVAVTQNYCCSSNFARVWPLAAHGRPQMARTWLRELRQKRPELARGAEAAAGRGLDGASASSSSSSSSSSTSSSSSASEDEKGERRSSSLRRSGSRSMPASPPGACAPAVLEEKNENGNGDDAKRSSKRRNVE